MLKPEKIANDVEEFDAFGVARVTSTELQKIRDHLTPEIAYSLVVASLNRQINQLDAKQGEAPIIGVNVELPMGW
ncbi:hypothetical protein [Roseibium marinum]|uniref:Uncharacterized protein n=1 Tax=Roseibium marinum TaxID=281252 RepID=A0A2S3UJX7_9HYPH|nr:hypothetical protein [Roseibium marinum]POF27787.1 hypothetical protein CLV41_12113 [Roseibium marinum]POF27799.1 hypothetical protein CLV41_12125 [Roseibium marinum]